MNDTTSLATIDYAITAKQYQQRVNLVQEVMAQVMKENTHYGTIPGCPKPSLYKPGAEVLRVTFNLGAELPKVEIKDLPGGHREAVVTVAIKDHTGRIIAEGVGSCSTLESKYRYRKSEGESTGKPVPGAYWDAKKANNLSKMQELLGGKGFSVKKVDGVWMIMKAGEGRTENPDPADQYNTVLKMAKKRAFVDAILTATGASDIFTQDIEDMGDGAIETTATRVEAKPAQPAPAQHAADDYRGTPDYEDESQDVAAYRFSGPPEDDIKRTLKDHGHRWNPTAKVWAGGSAIPELEQYRVQQ